MREMYSKCVIPFAVILSLVLNLPALEAFLLEATATNLANAENG